MTLDFFDKSISKMVIDTIAKSIGSHNSVLGNMLKEFAAKGEFKKAAELAGEVIEDLSKKNDLSMELMRKINDLSS